MPEFVIMPALLTEAVTNLMPLFVALLLLITRLPVPMTPLVIKIVEVPLLFVRVVPELFTVIAVVSIVSPEVVLFSTIPVTLEPTPAEIVMP